MQSDLILIRYSEIGLKGKQTRKNFLRILVRNIKNTLKENKINNVIKSERGRIFLETKQIKKSLNLLSKIFGIKSYSPAIKTNSDIKSISTIAIELAKSDLKKNQSFALRVTRTGTHDFSSMDVAVKIGAIIVEKLGNKVDLTNPDFEIFIDIRENFAYIFKEKICGVGGLPLGSQGNILTLVKSPESLLAAWYLMKRGCFSYFITFNKQYFDLTNTFCKNWSNKSFVKLECFKDNYIGLINDFIFEYNCKAVITDHSLFNNEKNFGDVLFLKEKISIPVLHPLIVMNQEDIEKKLAQIGVNL